MLREICLSLAPRVTKVRLMVSSLNYLILSCSTIDQDAFLLHTDQNTYKFQHRRGLYVNDLATPPEPRYSDAAERRTAYAHSVVMKTSSINILYTTKLATAEANEAKFSKSEVQRSSDTRR